MMARITLLCAVLALLLGGTSPARGQFDRPWRVYLVPFSHTDVGYTASVPDVIQGHLRTLDSVVACVQRTRHNSPGTRFRWTIEIPWVLPFYITQRTPAQVDTLMTCVRAGEIDIGAIHFGLQSDLCGNEELIRSLSYAQELRNRYGVAVRTGLINDTPGFTWPLAQLLARADVPYLSVAMNSFFCDFFKTTTVPNLFWWQGQDGSSTLVWRSIDSVWAYLEGSATCGVYGTASDMQSKLTAFLQRLAARGYPYNDVMINCATGDNGPAKDVIVGNAASWNNGHADAKVAIATVSEFFDTVGQKYAGQIPTLAGDAPNWWTWLFAPSATAGYSHSRKAQTLLPVAETFSAFADAVNAGHTSNPASMNDAYVNNLYFEDHNLGSIDPSGNAPYWSFKTGRVDAAIDTAESVILSSVDALAQSIPTSGAQSIAVFNSLGWSRSIPVLLALSDPVLVPLGPFDVVDVSTGRVLATQRLHDNTLAFVATDVPAVGYRVYRMSPRSAPFPSAVSVSGLQVSNEYYSVTLDPVTGAIRSLIDRGAGRDIVSTDGQFNQYRYNSTFPPSGMTVVASDSGAVVQSVTMQGSAQGTNGYTTTVRVWAGLKRVDCFNSYDKLAPGTTEGVDFAFHLSLPSPILQYEIPFGSVRPPDDRLSGFQSNHYAVRHWLNVSEGTGNYSATVITENATVAAIPAGSFNGAIRMLISFGNSDGAYRAGTGLLEMNFAITTNTGQSRADSLTRAAYGFITPAPVRLLQANHAGSLADSAMSFLTIGPSQLLVSTIKGADDGNGTIVRLFNPLSAAVAADLRFTRNVTAANEASLGEIYRVSVPFSGSHVWASFTPYEVKTLRVQLDGPAGLKDPEQIVFRFGLEQNYPNPFNPSTIIKYTVGGAGSGPSGRDSRSAGPEARGPGAGEAGTGSWELGARKTRLAVYDLLGRQVATLVNEEKAPGSYEVRFDGSGLASGIYFYRLSVGSFVQTRKMMLLR